MRRGLAIGWIGFWLLVAVLCLAGWTEGYWMYRDCFDAEGRCFDPVSGVVRHSQSGLGWGVAAMGALAMALLGVLGLRRRESARKG